MTTNLRCTTGESARTHEISTCWSEADRGDDPRSNSAGLPAQKQEMQSHLSPIVIQNGAFTSGDSAEGCHTMPAFEFWVNGEESSVVSSVPSSANPLDQGTKDQLNPWAEPTAGCPSPGVVDQFAEYRHLRHPGAWAKHIMTLSDSYSLFLTLVLLWKDPRGREQHNNSHHVK